jgi:hypothetical protein
MKYSVLDGQTTYPRGEDSSSSMIPVQSVSPHSFPIRSYSGILQIHVGNGDCIFVSHRCSIDKWDLCLKVRCLDPKGSRGDCHSKIEIGGIKNTGMSVQSN